MNDSPATPAMTTPAASSNAQNSRTLAAVAYVLTFITGIIIYLVAQKDDKYARWHAIQAIGFGLFALVVGIIVGMIPFMGFLGWVWNVAVIVGIVVLAIKAYQGERFRLPVIADMADKNA